MTKNGYRFIQALISVKTHKKLTDTSRRLNQSNAATIRGAIEVFWENPKCGCQKTEVPDGSA